MARIRTIKPEFWKDEELSELPEVCHMFAAALLNYADDEGYFNANLGLIKAEIFPLREPSMSIHGMISELSKVGYLRVYKGRNGKKYGQIVNFTLHQRVNRPQPSKFKGLIDFTEHSLNDHEQLTAGKEGKGKEKEISLSGDNAPAQPEKKSKTNEYPEQFCKFWEFAKSHYTRVANPVGNKLEAFEQFKKLKPTDSECQDWLRALLAQVNAKQAITQQGGSPTQLKHLSRWLKNRGWEDTPDPVPILPPRPGQPAALNPGARKREFMAGGVS